MKKALAIIVAIIAISIGIPAPANAESTGGACADLTRGIRTCATITWVTSTMTVTSVTLSTPQNCDNLESSGGRYEYFSARTPLRDYWHPTPGCNDSFGIYDDFSDSVTTIPVTVWAKARINGRGDWTLKWSFFLHKNGNAEWYIDARPL